MNVHYCRFISIRFINEVILFLNCCFQTPTEWPKPDQNSFLSRLAFTFIINFFCPPIMPSETKLSRFEQGQISALHDTGMIPADITLRLKRFLNVVSRYLCNPAAYNAKREVRHRLSYLCKTKQELPESSQEKI